MQQIELDAKLLRQRDHLQRGGQHDGQVARLSPYLRITPAQLIAVLMGKIIDQLLIFGMEQRHDPALAQNLENAGNITKMRDGGGCRGMTGGKDFDACNQPFVDLCQFVDIFNGGSHIDGKIGIRSAVIARDLLFHPRDGCCRWPDIGHVKDGSIAASQSRPRAVGNILLMLKPRFAKMPMYFNQTR